MTLLFAVILAPFTLLTFCFAVELFAGFRPLRQQPAPAITGITAVIIVPAHDEATVIGGSLPILKSAASDHARILVVADNCADTTAKIARSLGVEVIERIEPGRRGKGFALDFARRHLRFDPPDVVVIIDADCVSDAQSIKRLVARCAASARPCQAINLQVAARNGSPAVQMSTFAFFIKNVVRQRALQRLAGRVHLLGTGMALPWSIFDRSGLATDNIVEDLALGVELAEAGHAPLFVEEASVWSDAETETNTLAQRHRWEGGFLQNALHSGPRLLVRSLSRGDARTLWAAINVLIPPFALLVLLDIVALALCGIAGWWAGARQWPLLMLGGSLFLVWIGLITAWVAGGSRFVSLSGLARVPFYILWKLPLYLGLARRGAPKQWVRTRRG